MIRDEFDFSRWEAHDHRDVLSKVAKRSYRKFSRWLDRELEQLVARWAHTAAPNAAFRWRLAFRSRKPK
jgi:hypothetical protein